MADVNQPTHRGAERAAFEAGKRAGLGRIDADMQRQAEVGQGYSQGAADMGRQIMAGLNGQPTVPQQGLQVSPEEEITGLLNDAQNGSQEAGVRLNEIANQGGTEMINAVAQQLNNAQSQSATGPTQGDVLEMLYAANEGDQAAGDALNAISSTPEGEAMVNEALRTMQGPTTDAMPVGNQAGLRVS